MDALVAIGAGFALGYVTRSNVVVAGVVSAVCFGLGHAIYVSQDRIRPGTMTRAVQALAAGVVGTALTLIGCIPLTYCVTEIALALLRYR